MVSLSATLPGTVDVAMVIRCCRKSLGPSSTRTLTPLCSQYCGVTFPKSVARRWRRRRMRRAATRLTLNLVPGMNSLLSSKVHCTPLGGGGAGGTRQREEFEVASVSPAARERHDDGAQLTRLVDPPLELLAGLEDALALLPPLLPHNGYDNNVGHDSLPVPLHVLARRFASLYQNRSRSTIMIMIVSRASARSSATF